jgi:hypothetical protein
MRDVGHIPQIEDPDAFNAALLEALHQMRGGKGYISRLAGNDLLRLLDCGSDGGCQFSRAERLLQKRRRAHRGFERR